MEPMKRSLEPANVAVLNEPKKLKCTKKRLCVFTSASSTWQGATDYPVCHSVEDDSVLMTKCHCCGTWHCVLCYRDLQSYKHRVKKGSIYIPKSCPCIATFLDTEWAKLAECKNNDPTAKEMVEGLVKGTELSVVSDRSTGVIHLKWNHDCPSCYNFKVPTIPLQVEEFPTATKPETDLFKWTIDLIDPSTGGTIQTAVCFVVLSFSPVLRQEETERFMYRAGEEILNSNHSNCRTILPKRPHDLAHDTQFWLLSRGMDTGEMLSLTHVGCLDPHFKTINVSQAVFDHAPFLL
jgi:hypothetical protein